MSKVLERIKKRRKEQGVTQEQLAGQIGVVQNYYSSLETGKNRLCIEQLEVIAEALDCNPEDFFKDEEIKPPASDENKAIIDDTDKNGLITFRYSEKDRTAIVQMPKDVKPSLLKLAIDKAVASVKSSVSTENTEELVIKSGAGAREG